MRYPRDPYWLTSKYGGKCSKCGKAVRKGERIFYYPNTKSVLCAGDSCGGQASRDFEAARFDESVYAGGKQRRGGKTISSAAKHHVLAKLRKGPLEADDLTWGAPSEVLPRHIDQALRALKKAGKVCWGNDDRWHLGRSCRAGGKQRRTRGSGGTGLIAAACALRDIWK